MSNNRGKIIEQYKLVEHINKNPIYAPENSGKMVRNFESHTVELINL